MFPWSSLLGFFFFFLPNVGDTGGTGVVVVVFAVVGVCGPFWVAGVEPGVVNCCSVAAAAGSGVLVLFLRRGCNWTFPPPLFGGTPPLPGHHGPALLVTCFGLGLTRVLGRCCGGGAGCF